MRIINTRIPIQQSSSPKIHLTCFPLPDLNQFMNDIFFLLCKLILCDCVLFVSKQMCVCVQSVCIAVSACTFKCTRVWKADLKHDQCAKPVVAGGVLFTILNFCGCVTLCLQAFKTALTPAINSMSVSGLVSIPGMMTGQVWCLSHIVRNEVEWINYFQFTVKIQ